MPLMHGDYQINPILAQDVLNILRELSSKPQPDQSGYNTVAKTLAYHEGEQYAIKRHEARIEALIEEIEPYIKQVVDCDRFAGGDALLDPLSLAALSWHWKAVTANPTSEVEG